MNLASIIESHPAESTALISRGHSMTYGELRAAVARCRGGLAALGIERGSRVALLCGNGSEFVIAYLAVVGLGAVAVPLNPASPGPELRREFDAVGAAAVIVEPVSAPAWLDSGATVARVIGVDGAAGAEAHRFEALLDAAPVAAIECAADDLAVLIFTSGTAGAPRAAMLSHGNLLSNLAQANSARVRPGPDDVMFGVLPLHHIFGLNVVLGLGLLAGAAIVLVQRFDPATAADTIVERSVTIVPGAPPMWIAWAHLPELSADAFASVRLALTGAAKMPEEVARRLHFRFGLTVSEGYGLTEASPIVTSSAGMPARFGSVGKVLDGIDVRLVDEFGDDILEGDDGEIWVRGPNVFHGYLDDAEATAKALTEDGWLKTGDIAVTDADGFLYLVDRAKDLIIVSGFNVFPAEVETVLVEHPAVEDAAVIGVAHPHSGEAVKAFVVAAAGARRDEEQLIAHCLDHLARYKCPSKIVFVDALPRGANGKVLRRALV